jgi:hypothetical protein
VQHFCGDIQGWTDFEDIYADMVRGVISPAHFVEVGSWLGRSAAFMAVEIINSGKAIKFDCVDTWAGSTEHLDPASDAFSPELAADKDWLYISFLKNIQPVLTFIHPVRLPSVAAAALYADNSLDFVFIDAAHDYENVKADITAWYPKVKVGGTIAGHDYGWPGSGVHDAVNEYLAAVGNLPKPRGSSWIAVKTRSL